ncbi:MAG: hypothetical protein A2150_00490 [Candidatus Muproteobacteria bacterium RBG_16_64_11]|uniref:Regulatory protein RecX n=1 Tax=Candidatus Muproteobacteria bacterium RBG_16_64_11 TaxID=1817758 RepID=A0A1F6T9M5_9PROT|nr:MAG: hypothetical protein A2150_00490 [Candidatus Muproteobacteria bacterium RBG_16_64_11]
MKPQPLKKLIRQARDFTQSINRRRPGAESIALEKRAYERKLRAAGYSRAAAVAEVAKRYRERG